MSSHQIRTETKTVPLSPHALRKLGVQSQNANHRYSVSLKQPPTALVGAYGKSLAHRAGANLKHPNANSLQSAIRGRNLSSFCKLAKNRPAFELMESQS